MSNPISISSNAKFPLPMDIQYLIIDEWNGPVKFEINSVVGNSIEVKYDPHIHSYVQGWFWNVMDGTAPNNDSSLLKHNGSMWYDGEMYKLEGIFPVSFYKINKYSGEVKFNYDRASMYKSHRELRGLEKWNKFFTIKG